MSSRLPECVVVSPTHPNSCVIWLHGLGADGHDFEPIVPYLGLPSDLHVRFVFPHAPRRPVTLNQGMVMRAWYDIGHDLDRNVDAPGIRQSTADVQALIEAEVQRGLTPDRIVVAGFSQGGAMAYQVGLRQEVALGGVLVLSGYLLLPETLTEEARPAAHATPILHCHGTLDSIVPHALGRQSAERVRAAGFDVAWRDYPVAHSVAPEEIRDIGAWLSQVLAGA